MVIHLPASKSIVNRLLMIEAISGNKFIDEKYISCDDTKVLSQALYSASCNRYVGLSATAMRFMVAYLSTQEGSYTLDGASSLRTRPIKALCDSLATLGVGIEYLKEEGYLPVRIVGKRNLENNIKIDASESSQYLSALMLVAPRLPNGLNITLEGISSRDYIVLTDKIMTLFGVEVLRRDNIISIRPQKYKYNPNCFVESDFSSAVFWFAYFRIMNLQRLSLGYFLRKSYQPDSAIINIMQRFGVDADHDGNLLILTRRDVVPNIDFFEYNYVNTPDLVPVMAVFCCLLNVKFEFQGVKNLRIKESDRVESLIVELRKCGYVLHACNDTLLWQGDRCAPEDKPTIKTYSDHRIAMAFALFIDKMDITISSPQVVSKSYPGFWEDLNKVRQNLFTGL